MWSIDPNHTTVWSWVIIISGQSSNEVIGIIIINLQTAVCTGGEVTWLLITIPNVTEADVNTMPRNTVDYNETMATLRMHSFT